MEDPKRRPKPYAPSEEGAARCRYEKIDTSASQRPVRERQGARVGTLCAQPRGRGGMSSGSRWWCGSCRAPPKRARPEPRPLAHRRSAVSPRAYWALPMPTVPLMFAELTPRVTQFWSWVVGLNVSAASAPSPAVNTGSSPLIVKLAGALHAAGTLLATSARVMLAATVPCSCTAANAPVVL